jgi:hypothetical protein
MAYRDPTFNANMLTDLLDTYLTNQSKERERYFEVAQKQDKPMIRQGADGYLYYADKRKDDFGQRVFPDVEKPPKTGSQGFTTEEFFYKTGNTENPNVKYMLMSTENNPNEVYDPNTGTMVDFDGGVRPKYPTGEFKARLERRTLDPKTGQTIDSTFKYFDTFEEEKEHKRKFGDMYNEQIPGGKVGESVLLQKRGGQYFTADTQQPVDPAIFANLTKQRPRSQTAKGPKNLTTAYYPDGETREFDVRTFIDKDGNQKEDYFWLDTGNPILNTEWSNFALQRDDRNEKTEKKTRNAFKNLINKTLKPVYAKYADDTNFKMGKKWPGYQDMLEKEKTLIDNMFQGNVPIFTSIEDFKMQFGEALQGKTNEQIIDAAEQAFARSVSSGTLPKFYLHTTAFGSESEFSKMMSNFRNVNLGE